MNSYICLDGCKYATSAKSWMPTHSKPVTTRLLLNGKTDTTYGSNVLKIWSGEIKARVVESKTGYGSAADLETSIDKMVGVSFEDHFGNSSTVHLQGWKRRSFTNVWDGPSNILFYEVIMTEQIS